MLGYLINIDRLIGFANPSCVEPQHIDLAIVAQQLIDLIVGVTNEGIPLCRMRLDIEVVIAVSDRACAIPISRMVPIRFREINACLHVVCTEGIEHLADNIASQPRIFTGRLKVREIGVVHGVAIVVLCRKDQIAHSRLCAR